MKKNLSIQPTTILSILLFIIAIMLSVNVFAGKPVPVDIATQAELDAAVPAYVIGDSLPGGGIVFYIIDSGRHGLVAQPFDDAYSNWYVAKEVAENHGPGWRLPTKHELSLLYLQKDVVGGFAVDYYWSSTELDAATAWAQSFDGGVHQDYGSKGLPDLSVRAVRGF